MHMTMHNCVGIRVGMLTTSPTLGESGTTGCCLDTTTNRSNGIQSVPQHIVKANQTHTSMHNDHCRWIMSHTSECSGFGSAGKFCCPSTVPSIHIAVSPFTALAVANPSPVDCTPVQASHYHVESGPWTAYSRDWIATHPIALRGSHF